MKSKLSELKNWSFSVFDKLESGISYTIAFSGGKDSHVLLGTYLQWLESRNLKPLPNIKVAFADTKLEPQRIYELVGNVEELCQWKGIEFVRTLPDLKDDFWVLQFGIGYPVPDHKIRWCTSRLKIDPIAKVGGTAITGAHMGESTKRNKRLEKCGSSECGIDMITGKIDAIAKWSNCQVWDWIILEGDDALYPGFFDLINSTYEISSGSDGSLRMGCFMCPVISPNTVKYKQDLGAVPDFSYMVRKILDKLREGRRIKSPRTGNNGAIYIGDRRECWELLKPYFPRMKELGFISDPVIEKVESMLELGTYPKTYKPDWIAQQEQIIESEPLQLALPI